MKAAGVLSDVQAYIAAGLSVVPVLPRSKKILIKDWEARDFGPGDFTSDSNVGLRLGHYGLSDVDLDCEEARIIAPLFLPQTGFCFGRKTARASHYFYYLDPPQVWLKLADPIMGKDGTIVELRGLKKDGGIGFQTVAPGSIHEDTGEAIEFEPGASRIIANAEADIIVGAVHKIAAAALLARYFPAPKAGRNECFMAIAGMLARAGWSLEDAETFNWSIYRILWREAANRSVCVSEVRPTFEKYAAGQNVIGIPSLKDLIRHEAVTAALTWLQIDTRQTAPAQKNKGGRYYSNDSGNADRLVDRYGDRLLWVEDRQVLMTYTGQRWRADNLMAEGWTEETIRDAFSEAGRIDDEKKRKDFLKFLNGSLQRNAIGNAVHCAKRKLRRVNMRDFDANPYILNFKNGTVDLKDGALREHRPEDLISKMIPFEYDSKAAAPRWIEFLHKTQGAHPDASEGQLERAAVRVEYLQRAVGASAVGMGKKLLFVCYGPKDTGKTTLQEAIRGTLGEGEYAGEIQVESLMMRGQRMSLTESADIADLQGIRFVSSSEVEQGQRLAVARVQYLTGGGQVKACRKHENPFTFQPTHTIWLDANNRPVISNPNDAVWGRLRLIPFTCPIAKQEQRADFKRELIEERKGIAVWIVQGAVEYLRNGLQDIPEVLAATEEYRQESDRLGEFIEERCELNQNDPSWWIATKDLYQAYTDWVTSAGEQYPLSKRIFEEQIGAKGLTKARNPRGDVRAWRGIRFRVRG